MNRQQTANDIVYFLTVKAAFLIPLLLSIATGAIAGVLIYSIALLLPVDPLKPTRITFGVITAISWYLWLATWRRKVFIDQRETDQITQIEIVSDDGRTLEPGHIKASREQLLIIGHRYIDQDATISGGDLLDVFGGDRVAYNSFRRSLTYRGYANRNNPDHPQQGITLTEKGKAIMRRYASEYITINPPTRKLEKRN